MNNSNNHNGHHHEDHNNGKLEFFVDGEKFIADHSPMTANEILKVAGLNPLENYLVEIYKGRPGDSYENKGDSKIQIEDFDKFIAVSLKPTPVS